MHRKNALLYTSRVVRSLLKFLRNKREHYKIHHEGAAIDMASIMIGVLVVGTIGTLIATTVFVIVPWAQDEAAKNQLKSIMAAQQAYAGIKATEVASGQQIGSISALKAYRSTFNNAEGVDPSSLAKNYGDLAELIDADMFDPAFAPEDISDKIYGEQMLSLDKSICVVKLDSGAGYEAAVRSASGNVFVTNDGWIGPFKVPDTSPVCKGRVLGDYNNAKDTVIIPPTETPIDQLNPNAPALIEKPVAPTDGGAVGGVGDTATPSPTPTATATPTPTTEPTSSPSPTATPTKKPEPVTPDEAPEPPAANKNPDTKEFMFCHMGDMHTNNFNGMVNGHHGHEEDIMPPIPFKNYVGWNWNAETAKIYYNNCVPV